LNDVDIKFLRGLIGEFCDYFGLNLDEIMAQKFSKLIPISKRPYGELYTG